MYVRSGSPVQQWAALVILHPLSFYSREHFITSLLALQDAARRSVFLGFFKINLSLFHCYCLSVWLLYIAKPPALPG